MYRKKVFFIGLILLVLILGLVLKSAKKDNYTEVMEKNTRQELQELENTIEALKDKPGVEVVKTGDTYKVNLQEGTELGLDETEALRAESSIEGNTEKILYRDFIGEEKMVIELNYYTPIPVKPPAPPKKVYSGKLSILIDDVGMNTQTADLFGEIKKPVSFATLPFLPKSSEATKKLKDYGFQVILHMPMAGSNDQLNSRTEGILMPEMTKDEVYKRFDKAIGDVGGMNGFNNHMGSRFTEDAFQMKTLLKYAKEKNMFYIDSKTTSKTKGYSMAKELGVPTYYCSKFLDNSKDVEDIKKEIKSAVDMTKKGGKLLAIGHYHKNMAIALKSMAAYIEKEGIELVYVREVLE
ncbi:divergent polysaccharide deacetylase family protein [uncultured Ilyobacter sp.]|uniref:divergent polysaccharide deacetylase family protein n=1 Tax=uncultured Ilyobacter sp. TaxID=544433 RepID=UPI0029C97C89|nr:divergent polysaccharide deacetylase family protein [uncultured Ilyobacter sp.]